MPPGTVQGAIWRGLPVSSTRRAFSLALTILVATTTALGTGAAVSTAPKPRFEPPALQTRPLGLAPLTGRVPGLARDAQPASASISKSTAYQGGAVRLTVFEAQSASATFLGQEVGLKDVAGRLTSYLAVPPETPTGPTEIVVSGTDISGAEFQVVLGTTILQTNWTVDYIVLPPGVGGGLTPEIIQAETDLLVSIYSQVTEPAWGAPWLSPVTTDTPISGYFGEQRSFNGGPPGGHHGGTDFASAANDVVRATNTGIVVLAKELAVRGRTVIVDHGGGIHSSYSHLETILVAVNDRLGPGGAVGLVGTTGLSTGPHLHWELAVHGVLTDGLRWLDGTQGF